jgi:transposase
MGSVRCAGCEQRDAELVRLREQLAQQGVEQGALREQLSEQAAELAALRARLDALVKQLPKRPPEPPKPAASVDASVTEATTPQRKPGGQPGHPPHLKQLLPRERVQRFVSLVPKTCRHCQHDLPEKAHHQDPAPTRHQVADLPVQLVEITEYEVQARRCRHCGRVTKAELPAEVRRSSVGVRLAAFFAYLVGRQHLSKRGVEELSEEVLGTPISLGTVSNLEQETSAALASAHTEALQAVREAPVKHVDETGWKQAGCKRWLWVAATANVAVFLIHQLRNVAVLHRMLGKTLIGIVVSDRLHAYEHVPLKQRQLCWAHVKRNFEKLVDQGGTAQVLGEALLKIEKKVFELWHSFRGGGGTAENLALQMLPCQFDMQKELARGRRSRNRRVASFCKRLGGVQTALWTFVKFPGVEPTNNLAERLQRPAVIWRKNCYGCSSAAGCDFVARLLTVVHTLRLQKRPVLEFLAKALQAHRAHQTPPGLLATA